MKHTIITMAFATTTLLVSCKNPADDTADATVTEAVAETEMSDGIVYTFTEASKIDFLGSKVTGSHDGGFKTFSGSFTVKDGVPQGGKVVIDMSSTWSDADKLTTKLLSEEFFHVEKYPESTFVVTKFQKKSDISYYVSGNLTLHGVTKNITFPASVATSNDSIAVQAEFDINRKDFGITYPGKPDDLIRDEVVLKFDLMATAS